MTELAPTSAADFTRAAQNPPRDRKRVPPFSLRLSAEERTRLERDAAGRSLGSYVRSRLFGEGSAPASRTRGKFPVKDHQALGQVLARLGQSRLASNLNQIAKAVHLGTLPVTPETEADLRQAAYDIACLKHLLMKALGTEER